MTSVIRTVAGVLGARAVAHLTRAHRQDPAAVPKKLGRRSFVRNAALGGVVLNLSLLTGGAIRFLWPNKTGAFGKTLRVPASLIPPVDGQPYVDSAGKFYLVADAIRMSRSDTGIVRVTTPINDATASGEADAERTSVEFVQRIFPILRDYIPS